MRGVAAGRGAWPRVEGRGHGSGVWGLAACGGGVASVRGRGRAARGLGSGSGAWVEAAQARGPVRAAQRSQGGCKAGESCQTGALTPM